MADLFPRLLHPAYWCWQNQPAEMLGCWHWTGAEDLSEAVRRTGANATSLHLPLHLLKDERARYGVRPLPAPLQIATPRTGEIEFDAPAGLTMVSLLVTTSNSHAVAEAQLFAVKPVRERTPLAQAQTEPRTQPHIVLKLAKPLPAGTYRVHVRVRRSHAHVWLAPATQEGILFRVGSVTLRGWGVDGTWRDAQGKEHPFVRAHRHDTPVPLGTSPFVTLARLEVDAGAGIGEHNNAFFVAYPEWFWQMHPQSAMRDRDGNPIRAGENPWPAMDDAVLTDATIRQMHEAVPLLRKQKRVRYWVLGGEQGYPDYFGLPEGDFRPEFLAHYRAWVERCTPREREETARWRRFRESAMAERFALYTTTLRALDATRPIFIPTHGNPFALDFRVKMGFPIADLAGVADGFEAGPISIDDDTERLHRLTLDLQSSFGVLVVAPRLANKQLDLQARGGGRSFSPKSARRAVYEAIGMGVWHIGLVQWRGDLPDGEWGIRDTPAEAECRRLFEEVKRTSPWLEGCSRLHPQVGIYLADATWRRWWQDRWTLLYDLACSRGWNTLFVHSARCDAELAQDVPVLLSVDNPIVDRQAHQALGEYLQAGGRIVAVGALGVQDEAGEELPDLPDGVTRLPDDAPGSPVKVVHQTSTNRGAATWSAKVRPLPAAGIEEHLERMALLRPVIANDAGGREWAEGVECLPLTDGTNLLVVLLNRSGSPRNVQVAIAPRLLEGEQTGYRLRDAVDGRVLAGELPARVDLPAHGTRLLVIERVVTPAQCEKEMESAQQCLTRWRAVGVDTSVMERHLLSARRHLSAQRPSKAFALAHTVTSSLAIVGKARREGNTLRIQATVWQVDGKPAEEVQIRVRVVPGAFRWWRMEHEGKGSFSLIVREDALPHYYHPAEARYTTAERGWTLVFEARLGALRGGLCWIPGSPSGYR